jgi:hypothetical protein
MFAIIGPVIAAEQSSGQIAASATWSNCIVGMEWAGYGPTYALLAAATLGAIGWFVLARRRNRSPHEPSGRAGDMRGRACRTLRTRMSPSGGAPKARPAGSSGLR